MNDESVLRAKVRAAIAAGKVPDHAPELTWGGPGSDAECAICSGRVGSGEVEFEVEFARTDGASGLEKYHFHVRCFAAWELERRGIELAGEATSPAPGEHLAQANGVLRSAASDGTIIGGERKTTRDREPA
jgi:hypothetical protein